MKLAEEKALAIKTATKLLITRVGGLEAAASVCRLAASALSECSSRNHLVRMLPLDVALQLEEVAGEPILTGALARMQGYVLTRPDADAAQDVGRSVAAVARHAGEASARFMEAASDGRIDTRERGDLLRHAEQLREAADAMTAALASEAPALRVVA